MNNKHPYEKFLDTKDTTFIDLTTLYEYLKSIQKYENEVIHTKFGKIYLYKNNSYRRTAIIYATSTTIFVYCPLETNLKSKFDSLEEALAYNWESYL